jgi:hypothetical protein
VKEFFKITCSILLTAAIVTGAVTFVAKYFDDQAFRLEVKRQYEDKQTETMLAFERALSRFALDQTVVKNPWDLEYALDRTPVSGIKGAYVYTLRFADRSAVQEAMNR